MHGRTLAFSQRRFAQFPARYIRVAMWPNRPEKREGTDKWPLFSLVPLTYPATVCSISGSGTTLLDGTLQMLEQACLVFDDSCKNFTMSSITITGEPLRVPLPVLPVLEQLCPKNSALVHKLTFPYLRCWSMSRNISHDRKVH